MNAWSESRRLLLAAGFAVSVMTGCHHGEAADPYTPDRVAAIRTQLKYHNVAVAPFTLGKKVSDPEKAPEECHDAALGFLKGKNIFSSVQEGTSSAADTLVVEVNVDDLRIVGGAARFWIGAMAGQSFMHVNVVVKDASTGAVVFERFLKSDSNAFAGAYSWGATDRGLPSNVGVAIADLVIQVAQGQTPAVKTDN